MKATEAILAGVFAGGGSGGGGGSMTLYGPYSATNSEGVTVPPFEKEYVELDEIYAPDGEHLVDFPGDEDDRLAGAAIIMLGLTIGAAAVVSLTGWEAPDTIIVANNSNGTETISAYDAFTDFYSTKEFPLRS